ncbi:MAG: nucleotidyltransferase [Candidatus Hydrogenedentes bacterium]|nr:nucleotidyltransferase [Candidatus Hydrogenedentota bacterium]
MNTPLDIDRGRLASFCARWRILELDLFGSALRDDFGPESDVDLLAVYAPDARITLFDEALMEEELETLFGRPVDLLSRRAVEESPNWIRRQAILESMEPLYVAP